MRAVKREQNSKCGPLLCNHSSYDFPQLTLPNMLNTCSFTHLPDREVFTAGCPVVCGLYSHLFSGLWPHAL